MAITHNLGFPRIGKKRELKFALEDYWNSRLEAEDLDDTALQLRHENWAHQAKLSFIPVGDFSLYDHVLDMSVTLGNLPERVTALDATDLDAYFRAARGRSANEKKDHCVHASEMTKWFDINYHYIVPEFNADSEFCLNPSRLLDQIKELQVSGANIKPVIIGPVTYLWLGKAKDQSNPLDLLERLLPLYVELLEAVAAEGIEWIQIDEPILVTELDHKWQQALSQAYAALENTPIRILLATYFGSLKDNLRLTCELPVAGLHLDVATNNSEVVKVISLLDTEQVISLGVIDGRNIWKTDLNAVLKWLQPIADQLESRLWLAPSCSLLHVPVDLASEEKIEPEIKNWLAFAVQKLDELELLATAINNDSNLLDASTKEALAENKAAIDSRKVSERVHKPQVKSATDNIRPEFGIRYSSYERRSVVQAARLKLPKYPTTTIGSFPQTTDIRQARLKFKQGQLDETSYAQQMKASIKYAVEQQEKLGLDVLVHGEAERNDMVEYFGEQLDGYAFSQFGWVQSYGSRCVKPPILFGDISRPQPMTVAWTRYAQSLTKKPLKGMLTGPVTILNWSFVRDDQPRQVTCYQLALAIREEVIDLERAGVSIIQIDEAALREGLPLRKSEWKSYLDWAVESFRIAANGVTDKTQIHTHMCYSEFNDIMTAIAEMDTDVITIETSRSDMELLDVFEDFDYPNEIGPGVYDIHSPNLPGQKQVVELIKKAEKRIPAERLWVNPDCGLKTRQWEEVMPALENMIAAARELRQQ